MRKIFLFVVLMCFSVGIYSQNHIKGCLKDKDYQTIINYGTVALYQNLELVKAVSVDYVGNFVIKDLKNGKYSLVTDVSGYSVYSKEVELSGDLNIGELFLTSNLIELDGVEVVGKKRQMIYKVDKKVISASTNLVATSGGTASDVLSKVPSVRLDIDGNVSFRGSTGFVIQVNGKPSIFSSSEALRQIPASQIENIEIITTPSASNQTDGDVGIINIITKKNYGEGLSGSVNVYGSTLTTHGLDFNLATQKNDNKFTFGGIYSHDITKSDFSQEKNTVEGDESVTSFADGPRDGDNFLATLQAGWLLTKKQTDYYAEILGGYSSRQRTGDLSYTETAITGVSNAVKSSFNSKDFYDNNEQIFSANGGFDHKFKREGHTLSGYAYGKLGADSHEIFKSDLFDLKGAQQQGHQARESEYRWTVEAKLDYTLPYSENGRLEAGYYYNMYLENGDYKMNMWNPAVQDFVYRDDIYNTFFFRRDINTLYLLGNQKVGKFEFELGLRAELTHQVLESSQQWANRVKNNLEFFPSANASFNIDESSWLGASFSYRTNRPQLYYMEPYITFRDYYTAEIGNPDIRAEYINSYELSYSKKFGDNHIQVSAFHRSRKDKIERLRVTYEAGITLDSMSNVGNDYSTGAELGLDIKANKVWNIVFNGSVYYYNLENEIPELGGNDQTSLNYDIMLSNSFKVAKSTLLQVDATFVGPTVKTQGREDGYIYADFAVKQQLLKDKMSLNFSFRNFLNTAKYVSYIETNNLVSSTVIRPKFPIISLGLTYLFNNFKQKVAKQAQTSLFEGTNY